MLDLLSVLLDSGAVEFFENPAYLIGIPLLAVGALGALIAMSPVEVKWPDRPSDLEAEIIPAPEGHPTAQGYIRVGVVLGVITAIEVALYYIDMSSAALNTMLLAASALKFALVVLWFMHLYFDTKLFSVLFSTGLVLVVALFMVVLGTLGAGLV